MTIPAWQLIAWKPVLATLPEFRRALAQMRPLGGPAAGDGDGSDGLRAGAAVRQGQSLWAAAHRGEPLGLAWDWAEVCDSVVALSDPMKVLSNVRLLGDDGLPLGEAEHIVHLNSAVHELDWQPHAMGRVGRFCELPQALAA
ncbi:MAG: hypothetical protein JNL85_01530 [Rubrivivax sp.]|nr:hypothetical protein [Rubrivivax sp.]